MLSDLRLALRSLAKAPGFTTVALLTLALGIGLNVAMFNIVNSLVLQPLKFPEPDHLFRLERASVQNGNGGHRPVHFVEIARAGAELADFACSRPSSFTFSAPGQSPEVLGGARASAGYFRVLGVKMALGREFLPEEDKPGHDPVIILSHATWQSRFAGDPDIVGRTIRIDGQPSVVVGVASPLASDRRSVGAGELYRPLALSAGDLEERVDHAFDIIGRYRPGVTAGQAAAALAAITETMAAADPAEYTGRALRAAPLNPKLAGNGLLIFATLIGLSGFVLLIACANLANLLLARALPRCREFAIRGALGASRRQLMRPVLAESMLIALAGGALGLLVCTWTNDWIAREFAASGTDFVFVYDWKLLSYAFALSTLTGVFFGVAPSWVLSRVPAGAVLQDGGRTATGSRRQHRLRQALIGGQFALALVLLAGATFFVRGLNHIVTMEAGWQPEQVLRGILVLPENRYPDTRAMMRFYDDVLARVGALPGVEAAAICHDVPAFGFKSGRGFIVEGRPVPAPGEEIGSGTNGISPGYFNTLGTRLIRGRDFNATDTADSAQVIILNETFARALFPNQDALGQRLAYSDEKEKRWIEVVGVVEDVRNLNFGNTRQPFQAYLPLSQATWSYVALCVRSVLPPAVLGETVRRTVAAIDQDMPVKELAPVPDFIDRSLQDFHAIVKLLVAFAVLGLFLAALGIYSVTAQLTAQRTHEIGIRLALGAQLADIAGLIIGASARVVLAGTAGGLLLATGFTHVLSKAMPGLATTATPGLAAAVLVLIITALLASWLPARRATKVDPMVALRTE